MKLLSNKKIAITAFIIATLGTLIPAGVLIGIIKNERPDISANDLAEMKTLAHKYLNERNRLEVVDPDNNPKTAGVPVIVPSEMSSELAARQKEDVENLKARPNPGTVDNFATFLRVLDIRGADNDLMIFMKEQSYFPYVPFYKSDGPSCSGEAMDHYFKYARKGNGWILQDAKLLYSANIEGPFYEPSAKIDDTRVLANPPKEEIVKWRFAGVNDISGIPEKIVKLDEEATRKIMNKWTVDDKTIEAMGNAR